MYEYQWESPQGEIHTINFEYVVQRAEPDVGIMSDYAEITDWKAEPGLPDDVVNWIIEHYGIVEKISDGLGWGDDDYDER